MIKIPKLTPLKDPFPLQVVANEAIFWDELRVARSSLYTQQWAAEDLNFDPQAWPFEGDVRN